MIYVVGSGPSGVASAMALVRQGLEVTMLDVGHELEPDRTAVIEELGRRQPEAWDRQALAYIKGSTNANTATIPLKLSYGSDFPYRDTDGASISQAECTRHSFARGGLSNVWGAAIMPYSKEDIADWPIAHADLARHYEAVLTFMDIACVGKDDLHGMFPLYSDRCQHISPTRQAEAFMRDLEAGRSALNVRGLYFGYSRLAVRALPRSGRTGCVYCGLCMYGCPYRLIYNASDTLSELCTRSNFRYVKGILVNKVEEAKGGVTIHAESSRSGEPLTFMASRVYLACGVISTAKILLESLEAFDHPLRMQDSQYYLFPFVRFVDVPGVADERLHTLAQLFIEIFDKQISPHTVHLQVYTYSDIYLKSLQAMLGKLYPLLGRAINAVLGRLCVMQGYLHSSLSDTYWLRLTPGGAGRGASQLLIERSPNVRAEAAVRQVIKKVLDNSRLLKGFPVEWFLKLGSPGKSCFHSGGTFPMQQIPVAFQSDILGRPYGFQKVHVVDASILTSVPATTITFSVMANAHRIASMHSET